MSHRDREGDARLVYSMDAPEIYGPVAHQLTFAEAARRGIICRYQVVVSVVTSAMVNAHVLRQGEVIVQGDAVKARARVHAQVDLKRPELIADVENKLAQRTAFRHLFTTRGKLSRHLYFL